MLKAIICDWNRTLFPDEYEEGFFGGLCTRAFVRSVVQGQVRRTFRLMGLGQKCYRLLQRARRDRARTPAYIAVVTALMNRYALKGLPATFIAHYVESYARRSARRLDRRLLDPIAEVRRRHGVRVGILSSGCQSGIRRTLELAGHEVDFILANEFVYRDDLVDHFRITVMRNKLPLLERVLAELDVPPEQTMYVGDSLQDEQCFRHVAHPVLSFWTRPEERERFRDDCGAFCPPTQDDFRRYLDSLLASG